MRILHLSGAMVWGGNEKQLTDLITNLKENKIESVIFCFINSPIETYAIKNNIEYYSIPKGGSFSLKVAKELNLCVRKHKIDVIHIHTSNSVSHFMLADILHNMKIPTVFSKKGISDKSSFLSSLKYNYKGIDKIICVSEAVEKSFQEVIEKRNHHKLCVIYDGINISETNSKDVINLRNEFKIPSDVFLVGNIANHTLAKDIPILLKTANHLIYQLGVKNVHFIQIGNESKLTEEYKVILKELDLEKYFTFVGFLENAMEVISQFDVYLMSSQKEGLPITIFESFLQKTPVVSTMAGGIPEAIKDGFNGYLAAIKDDKTLAEKLDLLLKENENRKLFAENSYERLTNEFDAKKLVKEVIVEYQKAIDKK